MPLTRNSRQSHVPLALPRAAIAMAALVLLACVSGLWGQAAKPQAAPEPKKPQSQPDQPKPDEPKPGEPKPGETKPKPKPKLAPLKTLDIPKGEWSDLMKQIDLKKHRVNGDWQTKGVNLLATPQGSRPAVLILPIIPNGSYELEVKFTRTAGDGSIGVILPAGGRRCMAVLDVRPGVHGLDSINGKGAENNDSTTKGGLRNRRQYTLRLVVSVTEEEQTVEAVSVMAILDERTLFFHNGPPEDLEIQREYSPKQRATPALVTGASVTFQGVKLKLVSGKILQPRS